MSFHLEFALFWVSRTFDLGDFGDFGDFRRGSGNYFKTYIFEISACSNVKDEVCHSFLVEIFTKSLHRGGVL